MDQNQKDESLVKYFIGDTSESESEWENLPDPGVKSNLHDNTNNAMKIRTPMVPIDVNIIVETVDKTKKSKNIIANKGKKKITSRGDHSVAKQKEIQHKYIEKGKDLSKLKAQIKRQKTKTNFSMPKRKVMQTRVKREAERKKDGERDWKTMDLGKFPEDYKNKEINNKGNGAD